MSTDINYQDNRLTVTRVFEAPREAVFEAWTETSKVEQWWGCSQTTAVKSEVEAKVGGKYCHMMTIQDVGEHPMNAVITEYDPPARLAYVMDGFEPGSRHTVTVDFTEEGDNRTKVRLVHDNLTDEMGEIVRGGWTAAFDKLDRFFCAEAGRTP